jgi:ribose/xylose/arabinose/galactoside ABC-type transport system permease subunit
VAIGTFLIGYLKFALGLVNVPGKVINILTGLLLILAILLPGRIAALETRRSMRRGRIDAGQSAVGEEASRDAG